MGSFEGGKKQVFDHNAQTGKFDTTDKLLHIFLVIYHVIVVAVLFIHGIFLPE